MRIDLGVLLLSVFTNTCITAYSQDTSAIVRMSVDQPHTAHNHLYQNISYKAIANQKATVKIACYRYDDSDSSCMYSMDFDNVRFIKGIHSFDLHLDRNTKLHRASYSFLEAIKINNHLPVGRYNTYVTVSVNGKEQKYDSYSWNIDSTLPVYSGLRTSLERSGKTSLRLSGNQSNPGSATVSKGQFQRIMASAKVRGRKASRMNGVSSAVVQRYGKVYNALYYKEWFLGYYEETPAKESSEIADKLRNNPVQLMQNSLGNFTSAGSQFKKMNKKSDEAKEEEIEGSIDIIGNFSNGQEPNSAQDNNYQELRGDLHTDILNMPVVIEGYYTTQDKNRKAKASYIRVRYDLEKQKDKLNREVGNYKNMYESAGDKGAGITNGAAAMLSQLQQQQALSAHQFQTEYRISGEKLMASSGDVGTLAENADSTTAVKLRKDKEEIKKRYQQMQETQAKITKYQKLLDQYRNAQYFDSSLNYSKIQEATGSKDYSYKSLVKAAAGILPESKAKSFLSGLTKLNIGILNDYESNYTISGQTLKGLNFGYDLNLFTVGLTAGKTEYVSRNGDVDRYNTYLLKVDFKPIGKQKISLIYYGYTPTKQILDDPSFTKTDVSIPSFRQPVHIMSLTHSGTIIKGLQMESEGAYSYKNTRANSDIDLHHTAIKSSLQYELPKTPVHLKAEWEHVGKQFENNALPYTRAGIERYTLATDFSLFKSFLKAGVQFNRVQQTTFYSTGYNTKWGFDLQTKSKQYPNILVSYKPFSTFRRAEDTFAIAQRPVFGSVWIARATYQFKRKPANHRFMLSYNRNKSTVDTLSYQSHTLQANYIYTSTKLTFTANSGWSSQPYYMPDGTMLTNSVVFGGVSGSKKITKQLMVNLGQELAYAGFGLQRRATTLGVNYRFEKLPFTVYTQCRYASIRANEATITKDMWYGQLGVQARFKTQTPKFKKK